MRRTTVVAAVLIPLLGLAACGSDDEPDENNNSSQTTDEAPTPEDEPTEEESEPAEDESSEPAGTASGENPEWAHPVTTPGELLTTIEAGDLTVEVYQVGLAEATKDGMLVDSETKESIMKKGDEIVFVNYVVTNNGDPIDFGSSLVQVNAKYADWNYLGGMPSDSSSDLFEEQGVNKSGVVPGTRTDPPIYTLGSGQTLSFGDNFLYQKGSEVTFEVRYTPVDAEGELIHDERVEAEGTTTIK
ncbi:hypothetical protein [Nocardioides sp. AE5]|uniref:hypothetical protein n=1 Tax=Nocardioides sp. AE5 TaxID=2962573 RepID=UPI002880C64C|nr:hypothetical protein [Nocardioides sp. AE5]MDT0203398.1 hypothetical protein [Nocardioides sp. AE5]